MLRVIEVLDGGRVIVSTRGLRRVVIRRTQEVLAELLPSEEAEAAAEAWNAACEAKRASVVRYSEAIGWCDGQRKCAQ